ncbi:MAG TPA: hypothetical protein VEA44_01255 [Caulobacter sp.]|nr:hypothetical protein [Caulobacter sp.]
MDETEPKSEWFRPVIANFKGFAVMAVWIVSYLYLVVWPGHLDFRIDSLGLTFILAVVGVMTIGALGTIGMDQFRWYGAFPAPAAEGHSWRRSLRSRIAVLSEGLAGFWATPFLVDMVQQAYFRADWPRTVVATAFLLGLAWLFLRMTHRAVSLRPVLVLDAEGVREGEGGQLLPWNRVERIVVHGDLEARRVTLMTLKEDSSPGPARVLDLADAGVGARRFVGLVAEAAPQVEISWPTSRRAAFA